MDWLLEERFFSTIVQGDNRQMGVFIPAAGNFNGTTLYNRGENCNCWSSTLYSEANGYNLNFNASGVNPQNNNNRFNGFTVRAVQYLRLG